VPGIDFQYLKIPPSQGQWKIEQIVLPGTSIDLSTSTVPIHNSYANFYVNHTSTVTKEAPYPMLDVLPLPVTYSPPSDPWYPDPDDSPSFKFDHIDIHYNYDGFDWADNFIDYVMFKPAPDGIWVPEATFTWSLNGTATKGATTWTSAVTAAVSTPKVDHTAWPQAWNDLMYIYFRLKEV
jgi:hypothetical protein